MDWEEIDERAKQIVIRVTEELTDESLSEQTEKKRELQWGECLSGEAIEKEREKRVRYNSLRAYKTFCRFRRKRRLRYLSGVAALLVIAIGGSLFRWMTPTTVSSSEVITDYGQVTLLLSSGESILLKERTDVLDGGKRIEIRDGGLNYGSKLSTEETHEVIYNTLIVPRGTEYHVALSDGTKVYLNADSRLRYPLSFSAEKREVYLEGEAWFEVAKDSLSPFYVHTTDIQIRVYGTQFNVNTAKTNKVEVVLGEGVVGIQAVNCQQEFKLEPGQLATWEKGKEHIEVENVDIKRYIAWREGCFYFNDESLVEIMNTLVRWYHVDIFFQNSQAKELHFSGHLKRYEDVRDILKTITESTGIIFNVQGKTIIIQ